jgi:hypothetical protein
MKKILLAATGFLIATLFLVSCKKNKEQSCGSSGFDSITRDCIVAAETGMQSQAFHVVDEFGTILIQPGTIMVYKTSFGRYGKMQISSIQSAAASLTLTAVYKSTPSLTISVNSFADLDEMVESSTQNIIDFFWNQVNVKIDLVPSVGARFAKYNF